MKYLKTFNNIEVKNLESITPEITEDDIMTIEDLIIGYLADKCGMKRGINTTIDTDTKYYYEIRTGSQIINKWYYFKDERVNYIEISISVNIGYLRNLIEDTFSGHYIRKLVVNMFDVIEPDISRLLERCNQLGYRTINIVARHNEPILPTGTRRCYYLTK